MPNECITRHRQYVRRETVIQHKTKNKTATAITALLRSSIPSKAVVSKECQNIEMNRVREKDVKSIREIDPQLPRPEDESRPDMLNDYQRFGCGGWTFHRCLSHPKCRKNDL